MQKSLVIGFLAALLGSCTGDPTITSPVTQVALNASKAQTAETAFLVSVRGAECRYARIDAIAKAGPTGIGPLTTCTSPDMTDAMFNARKTLMTAIVEYAQALATVQGVSTDQFDADVKSAATQFSAAAKAGRFLAAFSGQAGAGAAVSAALGQIMDWIVQYYRKQDVISMAKSNQTQLDTILQTLIQENTLVAQRVFDRAQGTALSVRLLQSRPGAVNVAAALKFDQIFWGTGLSAGTGDNNQMMMAVQYPSATEANDALDQLRFCHDLVAAGGSLKDNKCKLAPATLKTSAGSGT